MKNLIIYLTLICCVSTSVFAEASFFGKKKMTEYADGIAVVTITRIEKADQKGGHWIYRQKATGTVETAIKGNIRGEIEMYGMEDFICAQCEFSEGRFLVFLTKDKKSLWGSFWIGSNWQFSALEIENGEVDWFENDTSPWKRERKPLKEVVEDIQRILGR